MSAPARAPLSADDATLSLWRIAVTENVDALEDVFNQGADINASDVDGMTALMRAAEFGKPLMARALIKRGANLDAVRADGFTPLLLAAFFGHAKIVKLLVESGADVSCTTRFDTSAEMWAKARTFYGVVRYLQEAREKTTIAHPQLEEELQRQQISHVEAVQELVVSPSEEEQKDIAPRLVVASQQLDLEVISPVEAVQDFVVSPISEEQEEITPTPIAASSLPEPELVSPIKAVPEFVVSPVVKEPESIPAASIVASPLLDPKDIASYLSELGQPHETSSVEWDEILSEEPEIHPARLVDSYPPPTQTSNGMPQIRTLSDPPEIWDLVPPEQFIAGSSFFTRLTSGAGPIVLGLALLLLAGLGVFMLWKSRLEPGGATPQKETQASVDHKAAPPSTSSGPSTAQTAPSDSSATSAPPAAEINTLSQESASMTDSGAIQPVYRRSGFRSRARKSLETVVAGATTENALRPGSDSEGVAKNDSNRSRSANGSNSDQTGGAKKVATPTVSPQMITPNTPAAPKGKVIQWP